MPNAQESSYGRLEVAISPEYLNVRMNSYLLLSSSVVNGGTCCFFYGRTAMRIRMDLVPQPPATRHNDGKHKELLDPLGETDLGSVFRSGQKKNT